MEICSFIDECDEYFKNYNFHKSLKSYNSTRVTAS